MANIHNDESDTLLSGTSDDDFIDNQGSNVTINAGDGNDYVYNDYGGDDCTINTGAGNDSVYNSGNDCTINTGAGNDSVYNSGNDCTINTGEDDDLVDNLSDNAKIDTGEGNDSVFNDGYYCTINTSAGNDSTKNYYDYCSINAGAGDDYVHDDSGDYCTINTGAGNDTIRLNYASDNLIVDYCTKDNVIIYNAGDGNDVIYGFNDDDILSISGSPYSTIKRGTDIIVTVNEGTISLIGAASLKAVNINGLNTIAKILVSGTNETDFITNYGEQVTISTGDGDDTVRNVRNDIYGSISAESVSINTGDGNDSIYNYWGSNATINTDEGDDSVHNYCSSCAIINTDAGNDYIDNFEDEFVTVDMGAGNDSIENYGSYCSINMGAGDDSVYNWGNNTTINTSTGNDSVYNLYRDNVSIDGGAGKDFIHNYGLNVSIIGGKGNDTISFSSTASLNVIQYANGDGNDLINGFNATSTLSISGSKYSSETGGDDIIITVGDGSITLRGAASLSAIHIDGEEEDLTALTFNNKTDSAVTLPAQTEIVDAYKRSTPIQITGNDKDNSLVGGFGNDTINGTSGDNTLTGGKGKDLFIYTAGKNIITDYEKKYKISVASAYEGFALDGSDLILNFGNDNSLTIKDGKDKAIKINSDVNFYTADGMFNSVKTAATLSGSASFNAKTYSKLVTITGSDNATEILGNKKANIIYAGNGGSTLNGGKGNDTLIGGSRADVFVYEKNSGKDLIVDYGAGDKISVKSGAEITDGSIQNGDAVIKVGNGSFTVKDTSTVTLTSTAGDTLFSNGAFVGESTAKVIGSFKGTINLGDYGVSTFDASLDKKALTINGTTADDSIVGGSGNDTLDGSTGDDTLTGGEGSYTFIFCAGKKIILHSSGRRIFYGKNC